MRMQSDNFKPEIVHFLFTFNFLTYTLKYKVINNYVRYPEDK